MRYAAFQLAMVLVLGLAGRAAGGGDADRPEAGLTPEESVRAAKLIEDLGSQDFHTREAATEELFKMGPKVASLLDEHKNSSDLEVMLRVRMLLQELPSKYYRAVHLAKAPTIDGKIEGDEGWAGANVQKGGFQVLKLAAKPTRATHFRIGYTGDTLYVGVTCFEPKPKAIKAAMKDGGQLFQEDSIELFLMPGDGPQYHQLVANAIGSRWNDEQPRRNMQLKDWKAAAQKDDKSWTLEMAIPFDTLGAAAPGRAHETWRFNICRNIHSDANQLCSWAEMKENFHEPQNFARLAFERRKDDDEADIEAGVKRQNLEVKRPNR